MCGGWCGRVCACIDGIEKRNVAGKQRRELEPRGLVGFARYPRRNEADHDADDDDDGEQRAREEIETVVDKREVGVGVVSGKGVGSIVTGIELRPLNSRNQVVRQ